MEHHALDEVLRIIKPHFTRIITSIAKEDGLFAFQSLNGVNKKMKKHNFQGAINKSVVDRNWLKKCGRPMKKVRCFYVCHGCEDFGYYKRYDVRHFAKNNYCWKCGSLQPTTIYSTRFARTWVNYVNDKRITSLTRMRTNSVWGFFTYTNTAMSTITQTGGKAWRNKRVTRKVHEIHEIEDFTRQSNLNK